MQPIAALSLQPRRGLELVSLRGSLALVGPEVDKIARKWSERTAEHLSSDKLKRLQFELAMSGRQGRDGDHFHITVVSSQEMKIVGADNPSGFNITSLQEEFLGSQKLKLLDMGVGKITKRVVDFQDGSTCFFVIVISQLLQKLRKRILSSLTDTSFSDSCPIQTDFHITLGFCGTDIHGVNKGVETLFVEGPLVEFAQKTEEVLRTFSNSSGPIMKRNCQRLVKLASERDFLFAGYYSAKSLFVTTGGAQTSFDLLEEYLVRRESVCRCINPEGLLDNEGNPVDYGKLVCDALNKNLFAINPAYRHLRRHYKSTASPKDSFTHYTFSFIETPRNFSFVTPNLAGSSIPDKDYYISSFADMGITDVITLMEHPLSVTSQGRMKNSSILYHFFAVDDQRPPSTDQMIEITKIFSKTNCKALIHCMGGVGRTATALCACLMFERRPLSPSVAKDMMAYRKTILHPTQEDFLNDWYSYCSDLAVEDAATTPIDPTPAITNGEKTGGGRPEGPENNKKNLPPLIMCVGLPASGKSTFSQTLCDYFSPDMHRINQDEQGRRECETRIGRLVKTRGATVVLDRCNLSKMERKEWVNLAHNTRAWAIHFDVPEEECRWRIVRRQGHPTLRAGAGSKVITSVAEKMEVPTVEEGFEKIHVVRNFEDSNALLKLFGCSTIPTSTLPAAELEGLVKFPRTRHLANLGSATRDDLVMTQAEVESCFLNRPLFVEEKIDGANMGISIKDNKLVAQNRSHYVSSTYHAQFKFLDKWLLQHSDELWDLLESSDRYILYGEWVYAKHSIHYSKLPDWFVVFDMFDKLDNKFWSRNRLEERLRGTSFFLIPVIKHESFKSLDQLRALVQTKSMFYDGPVEGVYVRSCDNEWLVERGKIVRPDFIAGDEHWTKGGCIPNAKSKDLGG